MSELKQYIEQINKKSGVYIVTDVDVWAAKGVTTIEQYDRYSLECDVSEMYREIYGCRPAVLDMTDQELNELYDSMLKEW